MTKPAKASTQYNDFQGTIAVDGWDGLGIFDLIKSANAQRGYYPVGLRIYDFGCKKGELPKLKAKVLCVDIEQVGNDATSIATYCKHHDELHTFEFDAEIDVDEVLRKLKRLDVVLLPKLVRGVRVVIQTDDD